MNTSRDPGWAARMMDRKRCEGPKLSGGRGPAAGARIRRANGTMGPEVPLVMAAQDAKAGESVVEQWHGTVVAPSVQTDAARLPRPRSE